MFLGRGSVAARTPRDDRGGEPRGQRHAGERKENHLSLSWPMRGAMIARGHGGTGDQRLQREGSQRAGAGSLSEAGFAETGLCSAQ